MHQIVYTSTATERFSPANLKKLLLDARKRNSALGVSGMLVFHGGTFLQALEGEKRAVNEIFASIASDQRHGDIDVLHRGPGIDQRVFGDVSMGFADFTGAADILKGFIRLTEQVRIKELDGARAMEPLASCGVEEEHKPDEERKPDEEHKSAEA
jgi:Sensors of blue-light using FAD